MNLAVQILSLCQHVGRPVRRKKDGWSIGDFKLTLTPERGLGHIQPEVALQIISRTRSFANTMKFYLLHKENGSNMKTIEMPTSRNMPSKVTGTACCHASWWNKVRKVQR